MASSTLNTFQYGYSKSILSENDISEKFMCNLCDGVLRDPLQSYCGHRYCRPCIEGQIRETGSYRCLICFSEDPDSTDSLLTFEKIYPDRGISREMRKLIVKCVNNGCDWKGVFIEYQEHEVTCVYMIIICPVEGCNQQIQRKNLEQHSDNECSMRIVTCYHCNAELIHKDISVHLRGCPKMVLPCTFCGKKLPREKLQEHIDIENGDCPNTKRPCTFLIIGCTTLVEKGREEEHNTAELQHHMQLLLKNISELKKATTYIEEDGKHIRQLNSAIQRGQVDIEKSKKLLQQLEDDVRQFRTNASGTGHTSDKSKDVIEKQIKRMEEIKTKSVIMDKRVTTYQEIVAVLSEEVESNTEKIKSIEHNEKQLKEMVHTLENKCKSQDRIIVLKDTTLEENDQRIQALEMTSHNGILTWKIKDFARKRNDAFSGRKLLINSPYFFTGRHGYKLSARVYLNGDGMGKGNHVSLFFIVMRGEYDAILVWPFKQKITLMWLDQSKREHVIDAFRPDPSSSSFQRPAGERNLASGCPLFLPLSLFDRVDREYVKDDTAFIRVIVDTSDL